MSIQSISVNHAVVLAGGKGQRMGGVQKALLLYQGKPILSYILDSLSAQVNNILLNVNSDFERYDDFKCPVFSDQMSGFLGPLEGMASAWECVPDDWILFVPCDNPFLPENLLDRMLKVYKEMPKPLLVVHDGVRMQPLYCLMHRSLQPNLQKAVSLEHLSVRKWIYENEHLEVDFSDLTGSFQNFNFEKDLLVFKQPEA